MRLSLNITNFSWPGDSKRLASELASVVRAADDAGLDTVWVADHLIQGDPTSTPEAEMLEAYTTLGYLAARSQRIRLGTMVTGVTYRPPALLIKAVTTLDVLSGGRAWLGVGSGYHGEEARIMASPSRPSPNGSSGARRPFGSPYRCGPVTMPHSREGTTGSSDHSAAPRPYRDPIRRY